MRRKRYASLPGMNSGPQTGTASVPQHRHTPPHTSNISFADVRMAAQIPTFRIWKLGSGLQQP